MRAFPCLYIVYSLHICSVSLMVALLLWPFLQVSGQEDFSQQLYSRKLLAPLWPSSLGVTDKCQYATLCQPKKLGELQYALTNMSLLRMGSLWGLLSLLSSFGMCCMRHLTKILSFYFVYELNMIFSRPYCISAIFFL